MRQFNVSSVKLQITYPVCWDCGVPMSLVKIQLETTTPENESQTFECKVCGETVTEMLTP